MDNVTVKFKGIAQADKNAKEYYKKKIDKVKRVAIKVGYDIERDAKRGVPVMYGRLQSSLTTSWSGDGPDHSATKKGVKRPSGSTTKIWVVVGSNIPYSHIQEFGQWGSARKPDRTDYVPPKRDHEPTPRPREGFLYLTKAYEANKNKVTRDIKKVFKELELTHIVSK